MIDPKPRLDDLTHTLAAPESGMLHIGLDWGASADNRARDPDRQFRLLLDRSRSAMAGHGDR